MTLANAVDVVHEDAVPVDDHEDAIMIFVIDLQWILLVIINLRVLHVRAVAGFDGFFELKGF